MFKWLIGLISDTDEKKIKKLLPVIDQINSLEPEMKKLSDEELRAKTSYFKAALSEGKTLDDILPEAFAVVREASCRTLGLRHFDVQLIGGMILHQGKISEMKTGEGKTLVATLPVYLNALSGKGVHIVTVNDYLAKRDSEWMGPIYKFLGLEVGCIQSQMEPAERKINYAADVTFGTNNEFGFDYLRDNMATSIEDCVQRELNFAIVDEVDSILVDEARTPLIISGMVEDSTTIYLKADQASRRLVKGTDFTADEKTKNAILTEIGVKKLEKVLGVEYIFDIENMELAHQILQALKALHLYDRDVDYVIKDGEIIIVDEFTGRLMIGRRYSDGLHQAIEAKEKVEIRQESQTLATITFQNYFRLYNKLAGMTGTAKTEEGEFWKIYKLEVMVIPTHNPMIRQDFPDVVYKNKKGKFKAVVDEAQTLHKSGQPVLVGTISIENSELISEMLRRRGVAHHVLNAKQHAREAEIVAQAGQKGQVTIATNMAGRGTDIVLGDGVVDLGGLHIIGTERHESRRIDNQLRGRSGRQGDPGSSRFYVCLEDELMRLFGSDRIAGLMERLGLDENTPIEHGMVSSAIERAQKKVEDYNFSIRKQVLEFDDVMNKQRDAIYSLRRRILEGRDLKEKILEMARSTFENILGQFIPEKADWEEIDWEGLKKAIFEVLPIVDFQELNSHKNKAGLLQALDDAFSQVYSKREAEVSSEQMRFIERLVMLRVIDAKWIEQLDNMDHLREGIGLRAYGQMDPLIEYKMEGFNMFNQMMRAVREEVVSMILRVQITRPEDEIVQQKTKITSYGAPAESAPEPVKRAMEKIGRNDPCPCGSGKKYKKCHLSAGATNAVRAKADGNKN